MPRSKSSHRWLKEHFDDHYVKLSQQHGYRARSAFKLEELADKYDLFKNVRAVVDLGAAPGGWCQVAKHHLPAEARVIGLDLLEIDPLPGVDLMQGDFRENAVLDALMQRLDGAQIDLVLSDMAPNMSGMSAIDQPKSMYLAELALDFCQQCLNVGGHFVVKLFQGEGFDEYLQQLRQSFERVVIKKPKASRPRSKEVYAVALGKKDI